MNDILGRFVQQAPVAVMVRATTLRVLADTTLNELFDRVAQIQYSKELTFSTLAALFSKVTFGTYAKVHAAYRHTNGIPVSVTAVYDKLAGIETAVCQALVQETALGMRQIIDALSAVPTEPIAGLRLRTLDGNFLAGTDHRLQCLRGSGAAALPGMSLVVREGCTGLLTDVIPCEDAYTNERSLHPEVLALVRENDLWLMDRNFCTLDYLAGIEGRKAFYLVRHHAGSKLEPVDEQRYVGSNKTGDVDEQKVRIGTLKCRCIIVRLFKPLRDGSKELRLLTNVPASKAGAKRLAELYRTRWHIETSFQELTENLCCEVNTLGYPKAALFAFCLALVAYNVLRVIQTALAAGQGQRQGKVELSSYHLATEVSAKTEGMVIAVPAGEWQRFVEMTTAEFAAWLHSITQRVDYKRYRKNKRAPKKPTKIKRTCRGSHRSTARELKAQTQSP
jgi:hypothetical protein